MSDFLFHKVSEKEKEEIKKQAKAILDKFSKKLSRVGKSLKEPLIEREKGERDEAGAGKSSGCSDIDRKIMFENAGEKNKDFIIAERGEWK